MVETRTSRFTLPQWSEDTDFSQRADFNEAFLRLEQRAAMYVQGLRSARPAAGTVGRYYVATDSKAIYYDDGTNWSVVGALLEQTTARSTAAGNVPLTVQGFSGQTANLTTWKDGAGTTLASVSKDGSFNAVDTTARHGFGALPLPDTGTFIKAPPDGVGHRVRRTSGTECIFRVEDWDGSNFLCVNWDGKLITPNSIQEGLAAAAIDIQTSLSTTGGKTPGSPELYVYTPGDAPARVTFIAPQSGKILIYLSARLSASGASWAYMGYEIHNENVSGSIWQAATDNRAMRSGVGGGSTPSAETKFCTGSTVDLVTGLTPGNQYFIRTMEKVIPINPVDLRVYQNVFSKRRQICLIKLA